MNKFHLGIIVIAVVGLVLIGVGQLQLAGSIREQANALKDQGQKLGAVIGFSGAMSNQALFNSLQSLANDVFKIASSTGNGLRAQASWNPNGLSSSSPYTTTTVTVTGAALGDFAFASFDSATSVDDWSLYARVSVADTVLVTMSLNNSTSTSLAGKELNLTGSTLRVKVYQNASTTLETTTSTSISN